MKAALVPGTQALKRSRSAIAGVGYNQLPTHFLDEEAPVESIHIARWSFQDWVIGTKWGQILMMLVLGVLLNVLGALTWMSTGGNETYDTSWSQSLWFAWGMFMDTGTQMGWDAAEDEKFKLPSRLVSIMGFLWNLVLLSMVVEEVRTQLEYGRTRRSRVVANGHRLVLGWTNKTPLLLRELVSASENRGKRHLIVLLADVEVELMQSKIDYQFPTKEDLKGQVIECRSGNPKEAEDLDKVSAVSAEEIIVLGTDEPPAESDLDVVQTITALAALPHPPNGNLIAEVQLAQTLQVVDVIMQRAEGIIAREAIIGLLCQKVTSPSIGSVFEDLFSFDSGKELYCGTLAEFDMDHSRSFGDCCREIEDSCVIGVKPPHEQAIIAPANNYVLGPNDKLLVIAEDLLQKRRGVSKMCETVMARCTSRANEARTVALGDQLGGKEFCEDSPNMVIIIGWHTDLGTLLSYLSCFVPDRTSIHILANLSAEEQRDSLKQQFFGDQIGKVEMVHYCGLSTDSKHISQLPFAEATVVLVLSEDNMTNLAADAAVISSTVTILEQLKRIPQDGGQPRVICEVRGARTKRMLDRNASLRQRVTFFHRNALEVGLFAAASVDRAVYNTLLMLLQPNETGNLVSQPFDDYIESLGTHPTHATFWDIHDAVRKRGEILVGWKQQQYPKPDLCPQDKRSPCPLVSGDMLILVQGVAQKV